MAKLRFISSPCTPMASSNCIFDRSLSSWSSCIYRSIGHPVVIWQSPPSRLLVTPWSVPSHLLVTFRTEPTSLLIIKWCFGRPPWPWRTLSAQIDVSTNPKHFAAQKQTSAVNAIKRPSSCPGLPFTYSTASQSDKSLLRISHLTWWSLALNHFAFEVYEDCFC